MSDYPTSEDQVIGRMDIRQQHILEHLPVAIYTCNAEGYITEYNEAAASLWGRRPQIGKEMWCGSWKIFSPDGSEMDLATCPMSMTLREGRAVHNHLIIIERPDGTRRWVRPNPTPLFSASGQLEGAINMLEDVTDRKMNEEEKAHLAAIVESSDDAIVSKNLNGIVTSWNKGAQRIFGYTAEEMIGQPILKLIPEDRKDEEPQILGKLRKGERVDHFVTKRVTKDRRLLDISLTISPIRDSKGNVIGVSKIARDITAQKLAEEKVRESEERFRMAISATRMGTWEYAPDSGDLQWSDECRAIYDLPADIDPSFELFMQLIHPDDLSTAGTAISEAMKPGRNGNYDIEFRILRHSDRSTRWIRSQGKAYFSGKGRSEKFIGTVLDITDEKVAKAELEQKVLERTKDLKEANQQLAISNKELEQFAFVASHDLQEPLRKIQAFGDMLKARFPEGLGEEATDLVNRMQSASGRMKSLIDSLLSFSRVTFKKEEHRLVNLSHLLEDVMNDLEASIREKGANISVGKLFPVKGEPMHLRQLFQNLLGNALKFSKKDETPEIRIHAQLVSGGESGLQVAEEDARKTFQLIEVIDNGIGFEPEYAQKIFQMFQRLHGKTEYPGSGMGLSIVQKVINNHHGYIQAVSSPNVGTNFRMLLPFEH